MKDNTLITAVNDPAYRSAEYYYTDAISDHAAQFIREHKRDHGGQPFLLYVPFAAAHWPMHARESDIVKSRGRYDAGYAPIRAARWEKQKNRPRLRRLRDRAAGRRLGESRGQKKRGALHRSLRRLTVMDEGIGCIVAELKRTSQYENAVICYKQDNSACAELNGRNGPATPRTAQPSIPLMTNDEQQLNGTPRQTRDGWPVRSGYGTLPGPADTYLPTAASGPT